MLVLLVAMPVYADMSLVSLGNMSATVNQSFDVAMRYRGNESGKVRFFIVADRRSETMYGWGQSNDYGIDEGSVNINGAFDRYTDDFTLYNTSGYRTATATFLFNKNGTYMVTWGFGNSSQDDLNASSVFYVFVSGDSLNTTDIVENVQSVSNYTQDLRQLYKDHPELLRHNMTIEQMRLAHIAALNASKNATRNVTVVLRNATGRESSRVQSKPVPVINLTDQHQVVQPRVQPQPVVVPAAQVNKTIVPVQTQNVKSVQVEKSDGRMLLVIVIVGAAGAAILSLLVFLILRKRGQDDNGGSAIQ